MFHLNSLGKGGAERVVSLLANQFAAKGYTVSIATEWQEEEEYPLDERVNRIHAGLSEQEENRGRIARQWLRVKNLRKVLKREKPDLLVSFCVKANYRAMMASSLTGIPVVVSVRNDPKIDYVGRVNRLMNKLFLNRASGCVFQTEEAQEFFDDTLQKKSVIICNPLNEKYLQAKRRPAEKKIVCVGRLVKQKNQILLLKAFEELLADHPDYRLYFYGDGSTDEYKDEIFTYVRERALLKETVYFMGLSSTLETDIADAAMFVLPSLYEGMPNALMEAMALGLPVISTDCPCGGSRYWITHRENGQLVEVNNVQAMKEAMVYYIEHPLEAEKMGQRARERLKEASLDKVYQCWEEYLTGIS